MTRDSMSARGDCFAPVWRFAAALAAAIAVISANASGEEQASFELGTNGALAKLNGGGPDLVLRQELGGFSGRDAVTGASLDFSRGRLQRRDGRTVYDATTSDGVGLHAEFTPRPEGYVEVRGYVSKESTGDRAIILDYRVGLTGPNAVFSNAANRSEEAKVGGDASEHEGNAFPVAALETAHEAVAIAIPYDSPCSFGMVGSAQGLAVRYYLGITPDTRAFPNRAPFAFIVYPSEPGWGFRSALERYYEFYPDHYEPRFRKTGYWMFQVKGLVPEGVEQYAFNLLEIQNPHVQEDLDRDDRYDIASLLYTLIGQREIKFLDKLPSTYDEAMKVFDGWSVESLQGHTITKENVVSGGDRWLREEVRTSAATGPDGRYHIQFRNTSWGKKSITFKVNPSPYLFADRDVDTVGRNSIRLIEGWLREYPQIDGVLVDSMGANWPATPDYRRDHIAYAQYPATFDSHGRLFVNNAIAHYEWCRYLGGKLWAQGKFLGANGLYAYKAGNLEHYRNPDRKTRPKLGRFFIASLLDAATSEAGTRAGTDRCQDVRIMMGRKYCTLTNYEWEDEGAVREFYNRSLAFGIFASNTKKYAGAADYVENVYEGVSYVDSPKGYYRDKKLIDWLLPRATMLQKAGWQPVTRAIVEGNVPRVSLERFGSGHKVYLTLFNDSMEQRECTVKVDLAGLGFSGKTADFRELAYEARLESPAGDRFSLTLEPFHAYIVAVSELWPDEIRDARPAASGLAALLPRPSSPD